MRQARSQVGSRLAVASSAKISRPRFPEGGGGGTRRNSRRNASTSADRDSAGSWRFWSVTFSSLSSRVCAKCLYSVVGSAKARIQRSASERRTANRSLHRGLQLFHD